MTPREGQKRATKILGAKVAWRDVGVPSSPEARAEAQAQVDELAETHAALKAKREELYRRLLADPEYVRLCAETKAAHTALDKARGNARYYRLNVGTANSLFFTVEATGDNWADVIRKLETKQKAE